MRRVYDGNTYRDMTEEELEMAQELTIPKEMQIQALKDELSTYDYIGVKIAMGVASVEDYAEQIAYTEQLRQQIRELEDAI